MPYAYGMQNSPVVGNGLGGLPRRTTATTSAAVATVEKNYTFSSISVAYQNIQDTSPGAFFYFDDNNIFWNANSSTTYGSTKFTFNRATSTLTCNGEGQATISGIGSENGYSYSIRISNTVVASPQGRKAVLSAGPTITVSQIVPSSGTFTVGGAYTFAGNIMVRVIPNSTNYVLVAKTSTYNFGVFVLDNTLSIVRSFPIRGDNSTNTAVDYNNVHMVDSTTMIVSGFLGSTSNGKFVHTCVDLSTNAILSSSGVYTQGHRGTAANGNYISYGSIYDRTTGRIHVPCSVNITTNNYLCIPYYCTFNSVTKTFTHWDGTTGNQLSTRPFDISYSMFYGSNDIQYGVFGLYLGAVYNEYGIPYSQYGRYSSDGYTLRLQFASQSFTEPSDFQFGGIYPALHPTGYPTPNPTIINRGKYQIWWNGDPSYGYQLWVSTTPISIGDNLYLVCQQRSNSDGWVYGQVFRRVES